MITLRVLTFLLVFFLFSSSLAQTNFLPKIKKNEFYKIVRTKLLKSGWKPYRSPAADKCAVGDGRCQGRPEMVACAGTGMANCKYLWRRNGKTLAIFTVGEDKNNSVSGYEIQ